MEETTRKKHLKRFLIRTVMRRHDKQCDGLLLGHPLFLAAGLITSAAVPSECPEVNQTKATHEI
jgi:hypothetical protein